MTLTAEDIEALFTRADGSFLFARWLRPIVPVVFGVEDATLVVIKGAVEAVVALAGHRMAETDTEQGANMMIFVFRDWQELLAVPDLDRLVEGLGPLVSRLQAQGANQYRHFRFEAGGAIRACVSFVCGWIPILPQRLPPIWRCLWRSARSFCGQSVPSSVFRL